MSTAETTANFADYIAVASALKTSITLNEHYLHSEAQEPLVQFGPTSRANIIVGANNSGKSRLLRALAAAKDVLLIPREQHRVLRDWADAIKRSATNAPEYIRLIPRSWTNEYAPQLNLRQELVALAGVLDDLATKIGFLPQCLLQMPEAQIRVWLTVIPSSMPNAQSVQQMIRAKLDKMFAVFKSLPSKSPIRIENFKEFFESKVWFIAETARAHDEFRILGDDFRNVDLSMLPSLNLDDLVTGIRSQLLKRVYLPVLRTANSIFTQGDERLDSNAYAHTARTLYRIPEDTDVFTGLDLYERFLLQRSGKRELRARFNKFEEFLSRNFFASRQVDIVPEYTRSLRERHIRINIGDSPDYELHHLGDGINALILLMYPIFMAEEHTWFFIEEPETHLHPGLQRLFIETLLREPFIQAKGLKFFFTTHSNHLLELAMSSPEQVSIFHLSPGEKPVAFQVRNIQGPDLSLLSELGVRNASVLLANCCIWVEGPSDRYYVRAYLDAYVRQFRSQRPLREDIDYSFFEYAGSNLEHYFFEDGNEDNRITSRIRAQFIANRVFLLADLDHGKEAKHARFKVMEKPARFAYATTNPAIEIENLLSSTILKAVLPRVLKSPTSVNLLKPELLEFDEKKLLTTRLGTYLTEILRPQFGQKTPKIATKVRRSEDEDDGEEVDAETNTNSDILGRTLKTRYKDAFAREVALLSQNQLLTWDMLSPEARQLTQKIVTFIEQANSN